MLHGVRKLDLLISCSLGSCRAVCKVAHVQLSLRLSAFSLCCVLCALLSLPMPAGSALLLLSVPHGVNGGCLMVNAWMRAAHILHNLTRCAVALSCRSSCSASDDALHQLLCAHLPGACVWCSSCSAVFAHSLLLNEAAFACSLMAFSLVLLHPL